MVPARGTYLSFKGEDTTICEKGTAAILKALQSLEDKGKGDMSASKLVVLSTTGISDKRRDIPVAMIPLYHWLLAIPHKDKRNMEDILVEGQGKDRRWVIVKPSLLLNGEAKGLRKVRVGVDLPHDQKEQGNAVDEKKEIGYTIRREDVGLWIYEKCVKNGGEQKWERKLVGLTY